MAIAAALELSEIKKNDIKFLFCFISLTPMNSRTNRDTYPPEE